MNSALKTISSYMASEIIGIFRVDLRDDTLRIVKSSKSKPSAVQIPAGEDISYSKYVNRYVAEGGVHADDIDKFVYFHDINRLRALFADIPEDKLSTTKYTHIHRHSAGGVYEPVIVKVIPTAYYTPQHPIIYLYIQDVGVTDDQYELLLSRPK